MTEFKRKPNGTYVRISNKKLFEERTAKKFK
jgi:predicted transcriptional regulator